MAGKRIHLPSKLMLRDFAKKIPGARRFVRAIRRLRFIYRLKQLTPTGPRFDLFCDFLYAWNRLQYRPRIRRPRTFNELVLASKHDFQGDMALARRITDKVQFKEYLAETPAWRDLIVPTLEVFDAPFLLRGRAFEAGTILKPTHMSGKTLVIEDRWQLTEDELAQFEQWQRFDYYRISREPCYAGLKPRIILEPLLRDQGGQPVTDFKFHMIGGRPLMIQVVRDRFTRRTKQYYSLDWEELDYGHVLTPRSADAIRKPEQLDTMLQVATELAAPWALCRIDLYLLPDGSIKAGEITLFPGAGSEKFHPVETDFEIGRQAKALMSSSTSSGNAGHSAASQA